MSASSEPLHDARVLLVEDDPDLRELFELALQQAGAEVRAVGSAEDAMSALLTWLPSIVVSDLSMPTTDGFALLREVRSVRRLRGIPAIAVSGLGSPRDREAALAAGFQAHVTKPVEYEQLVAVVRQWMLAGDSAPSAKIPVGRLSPVP